LKPKTIIYQKLLDTPHFRLKILFQKVLTALPPLELFSLEEKATLVAGWSFRFAVELFLTRSKVQAEANA
jgi:hypothetical protein